MHDILHIHALDDPKPVCASFHSFEDVKTYKKMTSAFTAAVKKDHSTIYHEIMKLKTYKLLVYSDFILYGVISLMHRKKLNIQ